MTAGSILHHITVYPRVTQGQVLTSHRNIYLDKPGMTSKQAQHRDHILLLD